MPSHTSSRSFRRRGQRALKERSRSVQTLLVPDFVRHQRLEFVRIQQSARLRDEDDCSRIKGDACLRHPDHLDFVHRLAAGAPKQRGQSRKLPAREASGR